MPGDSPLKNTSRGGWKSAIFIICTCGSRGTFRVLWGGREPDDVPYKGARPAYRNRRQERQHLARRLGGLPGGWWLPRRLLRRPVQNHSPRLHHIPHWPGSADSSGLLRSSACSGYSFLHSPLCSGRRRRGAQAMRADFRGGSIRRGLPEEKAAKSSFFNWWYVGIVCGATAAVLVVIYVEDYVGWKFGFGMLVVAVAAALVVFLIGSGSYRRQAPVGSPFTRVAQVVVAAVRKRRLAEGEGRGIFVEEDGGTVHPLARTSQFRDGRGPTRHIKISVL
ncbi:UNVERIFIED_CONTAM: protein NRT1/ PTR FAMILY 5.4 [Sesamum latifolium]|uniref:Protein NRT1/ PTR FAMILY 5.4 n=1 Tax=Sesamum latifolium TaxID=2727402 RepID=A0AAW2XS57_9LAMI